MKIEFIPQEPLLEYHGVLGSFKDTDEMRVQNLDTDTAKTLKAKFPNNFKIYDSNGKEIESVPRKTEGPIYSGPLLTLKFTPEEPLLEYHGIINGTPYNFTEEKLVQKVPAGDAQRLASKFRNNFEIVNEVPAKADDQAKTEDTAESTDDDTDEEASKPRRRRNKRVDAGA